MIPAVSQRKVQGCSQVEDVPVPQQLKEIALPSPYTHCSQLQKDSDLSAFAALPPTLDSYRASCLIDLHTQELNVEKR